MPLQTNSALARWRSIAASSEIVIDHPADRVDLRRWIATLSDRDYQACSRGHHAAGTIHEDGTFGTVNVESVGGHLLVQHYLTVSSSPNHLVMHSRKSRVYLMHLVPATIEVIWTVDVQRREGGSALLRCTVETRMSVLLSLIATIAFLPLFLRRHVHGETPRFAEDMVRKSRGGALEKAG